MTEQEFLTSEDPAAMLNLLAGNDMAACRWRQSMPGNGINRLSDRKLRLFACACCRSVWHLLTDERSRKAVEVAERFSDGEAGREESHKAFFAADKVYIGLVDSGEPGYSTPRLLALSARDTNQAHAKAATDHIILRGDKVGLARPQIAHLLREIVGNPFRPVTINGVAWNTSEARRHVMADLGWLTPQVLSLVTAAYEERQPDGTLDPVRLAVLSDALEEAGCPSEEPCWKCGGEKRIAETRSSWAGWRACPVCPNACGLLPHPILAHLRSPGPHVRGCWALDLVLGKE